MSFLSPITTRTGANIYSISMTCVLKSAISIYKPYGTSTALKMKRIGEYFGIKNGITSFIVPNVKDNIIDSCA